MIFSTNPIVRRAHGEGPVGRGEEYWIPECERAYLRATGHSTRALEDMGPHVREWDRRMRAVGEFYDHRDTDGFGRVYQVHRRTIMPAMRVCREWGSLLLDEKTVVTCESQACTDWLASLFSTTNFWGRAQETVVRAFGLVTGTFAVWLDAGRRLVRARRYDVRRWYLCPGTRRASGIARSSRGASRAGRFSTSCRCTSWATTGRTGSTPCASTGTGGSWAYPASRTTWRRGAPPPTFGIVRPAVPNTRVDFSPYGKSVFVDAVDAVQSVDLAYDALINEVDAGKMRVFLSDVMFDQERTNDGRRVPIPFGKGDCTVFRKVMSTEDTIQEFAPALRTEAQGKAFSLTLQVLGDLCGLGTNYFDLDNVGYVKTVTELSSDNSALMRNIRKNENALQGALAGISRAMKACSRSMGRRAARRGRRFCDFRR